MAQVTIYMDDDAVARAKACAAAAHVSLSHWITQLVKAQAPAVDAQGYPLGFFEALATQADAWQDFPLAPALRATDTPDLPRETW